MIQTLQIQKIHPDAKEPVRASDGAACVDLHAIIPAETIAKGGNILHPGTSLDISTGLKMAVPPGFALMIYSRSGHGFNYGVRLSNCVGVIDSDYRGEVRVSLRNDGYTPLTIKHGDRIAQAMLVPVYNFNIAEMNELSITERGEGGFGSTGK